MVRQRHDPIKLCLFYALIRWGFGKVWELLMRRRRGGGVVEGRIWDAGSEVK
jgi:hypothetical protein